MSWTIFISKVPVDQLEIVDVFEPIASKAELMQKIQAIAPGTHFREDRYWGFYRDEACSIEFDIGDKEQVEGIVLYVRGRGNRPILIVKEICEAFGCYAMDGNNGKAMDFEEADQASFQAWQKYRDQIVKKRN